MNRSPAPHNAPARPPVRTAPQGFISSRKASRSLLAGAAVGIAYAACPDGAQAQTTAPTQVPAISVEGQAGGAAASPDNTQKRDLSVNRLPGTIQDTPQAITVVTPEMMREQGTTTLEEALRNVPGITSQIGEGGGGPNGDQFRIRGIEAMGDVYNDGLREFGTYVRDSFNYESVEVLKGPSSLAFGRGTSGGAINTNSKVPRLEDFTNVTLSAGMGPLGRATADTNYKVTDTIAVRLNAMLYDQNVVDRDAVDTRRWGIAPSVGFGLGTDMTFTLGYVHMDWERTPDYGVPLIGSNRRQRPVTEFGVNRNNFYGLDDDADNGNIDQLTGRFSYTGFSGVKIYNDTRVGFYERYFTPQPPSCPIATCSALFFDNDPATVPIVTRGGPAPYQQHGYGVENVTTAVFDFRTGSFRHQFMAGIDIVYESNTNQAGTVLVGKPTTPLLDPSGANTNGYSYIPSLGASSRREAEATQKSIFASERFWIIDEVSVIGGLRIDDYQARARGTNGTTGATDSDVAAKATMYNPKASLVYEPTENQTYYASWAVSHRPPGTLISSAAIGNPFGGTANNAALEPERHEIFEIGAKIGFFDGRLGTSASIFRIDTDNSTTIDPTTNLVVSSGDSERTQGFELGLTGRITRAWQITAGYTFLDAYYTGGTNPGNRVQYTARHAATLWTTYQVTRELLIGGGFQYQSSRVTNVANTGEVPYDLSIDALISYQINDNLRVNLNGYNLLNRDNYTQIWSNRAVLSQGRTVVASTSIDF